MALDDHPLERTSPPSSYQEAPPERRSSAVRWLAVGAAGVVVGGLATFWWLSRAQPVTAPPAPTTATDVRVESRRPKRQPMDLPSLDASDTFLRSLVAALSQHPLLARLLTPEGLVRAATLAVVQIGDGRTPAVPLKPLRPATRLELNATGHIAPASYTRWEGPVAALTSVSPSDAAQLYVNLKPLFDEAFRDLGHPSGDFDSAIARAIETVAETPEVPDVALQQRQAYFEYDDAGLRSLPPVQKQFLLLGTENRKKVLAWLRQFAAALEIKVN